MELFTDIKPYPQPLLKMISPEGFEDAFWAMFKTKVYSNQEACYEVLEVTYERYFGQRKYADLGSFKAARRYQRAKRKNKSKV